MKDIAVDVRADDVEPGEKETFNSPEITDKEGDEIIIDAKRLRIPCMINKCIKINKFGDKFSITVHKDRITEEDAGDHKQMIVIWDKQSIKSRLEKKYEIKIKISYTPKTPEPEEEIEDIDAIANQLIGANSTDLVLSSNSTNSTIANSNTTSTDEVTNNTETASKDQSENTTTSEDTKKEESASSSSTTSSTESKSTETSEENSEVSPLFDATKLGSADEPANQLAIYVPPPPEKKSTQDLFEKPTNALVVLNTEIQPKAPPDSVYVNRTAVMKAFEYYGARASNNYKINKRRIDKENTPKLKALPTGTETEIEDEPVEEVKEEELKTKTPRMNRDGKFFINFNHPTEKLSLIQDKDENGNIRRYEVNESGTRSLMGL